MFSTFPNAILSILCFLTVVFGIAMLWFAVGIARLTKKRVANHSKWPTVSVVMPARNEAGILPWTISSLMKQDYPGNWELIVVDDRSEDETPAVLAKLCAQYGNLRAIRVVKEPETSPKKAALAIGISATESDIVFTTDADCQYHSGWIRSMVSYLTDDVGVVAGLTIFDLPNYKSVPVWQKVQWLDFFVQNFLAAGALGWNHAASCNGSNLCFRRQVYDEIAGYGESAAIVSGDDVLFAQRVASMTSWRMAFSTATESIVRSVPVQSLSELIHQRLRWASKGLKYRGSMLVFLFLVYTYYSALIFLPLVTFYSSLPYLLGALIVATKLLCDSITVYVGAKVFNQTRLLPYFWIYEIVHIVATPFFGFCGLLFPYNWKGDWYRTAKLPLGVSDKWLGGTVKFGKRQKKRSLVE